MMLGNERIDGKTASVEGGGAMGGTYGDEDAGFPNFQAAQPVDHGHAMNGEFFVKVRDDFLHFGEGHGFVGFVFQIESTPVFRMIAHEAVERGNRAI